MTLQRDWESLAKIAELRRLAAGLLLDHLLTRLPKGSRGTDLLADTTLGKMLEAVTAAPELRNAVRNHTRLMERALLWLHEQEVIRLNKGLAVFRPAMTIRLEPERRGFTQTEFMPLNMHYDEQVLQIHVMAEYAEQGLDSMADALLMAMDYFSLEQDEFLRRWLPNRDQELSRQTTPESWRTIVESLNNPIQRRIVADDREQTNVLVLAGPGSGKTRVLVHRIVIPDSRRGGRIPAASSRSPTTGTPRWRFDGVSWNSSETMRGGDGDDVSCARDAARWRQFRRTSESPG